MRNQSSRRGWWFRCCPLLVVAALMPSCGVAAAVYKCTSAAGAVEFRDRPCDAAATQREITIAVPKSSASRTPAPAAAPEVADKSATIAPAEPKDCSNWAPPAYTVEVMPPPVPDFTGFPVDHDGRPILAKGAGIDLVAASRDKPDPIAVQSACAAMIDHCFLKDRNPRNSIDACFNSAPRCKTARPWEEGRACCPQTCWQKYAELRHRCVDPFSASTKALFDEHCVPGVAEQLEGRTP